MKFTYLLFLFPFFVFTQNEEKVFDYLNQSFSIDKSTFEILKKNDTIIKELTESIKSKKTLNLQRRIDSFLLKSYSSKELILAIRIDRLLESGNFEFDRNNRFKNYLEIDVLNEINNYLNILNQNKLKNQINFTKKDSI